MEQNLPEWWLFSHMCKAATGAWFGEVNLQQECCSGLIDL